MCLAGLESLAIGGAGVIASRFSGEVLFVEGGGVLESGCMQRVWCCCVGLLRPAEGYVFCMER